MAQNTLEVFKEIQITHKGSKPDLKISLVNEEENKIDVEVSVNIKRHQFDEDCVVSFQPYNNRGFALKPKTMGTVGDLNKTEINVFKYSIDINKEDARFRLLVSKEGKFKESKVNRLVGKAEIKNFFEAETEKTDKKHESLLFTKEDEIGTIFKLDMAPQRVPWLLLKKGCNIKYNLDHNVNPIMKTLIYTSVVRDIIKTYLTDDTFRECPYREKWFQLISKKIGEPINEFPENFIDINGNITQIDSDAQIWIDGVVETMVSNLPDKNGITLIQKFKNAAFQSLQTVDESEEY